MTSAIGASSVERRASKRAPHVAVGDRAEQAFVLVDRERDLDRALVDALDRVADGRVRADEDLREAT